MSEVKIGKIVHFFNKISVAAIALNDTLNVGDTIKIKGKHTDFTQKVDSMQIEKQSVQTATSGQSVGIKVQSAVHEGDEVFLIKEE